MAELDAHAAVAVAEATVEESIAALEKSQQELQDASAATIAANLQQLTALQQRLEEDRARLAKQQKRTRAGAVPVLNAADIEQQRVLETEVNELRRRRDNARDGNARQSRKLATIFEECERLQHILDTPAGTAFPPKSARAQARLTPSERLEASMSTLGASMRAGPAGSALRAGLHGGNLSARSTTSAHGAAPPQSGAAIADRLAMERQERELHVAEAKLAAAQLKRDTYLHMRDRLTHEKLSFDPRFNAKYAELQRERKRVAKLRIVSTEATQAMANAESVRRATERKVAVKQQKEKDLLAQQQTTLLSTQQSVLHFEVSRMSRSQVGATPAPSASACALALPPHARSALPRTQLSPPHHGSLGSPRARAPRASHAPVRHQAGRAARRLRHRRRAELRLVRPQRGRPRRRLRRIRDRCRPFPD